MSGSNPKTVTIDHPHAEVIAAYYSGKTVQLDEGGIWADWDFTDWDFSQVPGFSARDKWRVKPEPLVRWAVGFANGEIHPSIRSTKNGAECLAHVIGGRVIRMVEQPE